MTTKTIELTLENIMAHAKKAEGRAKKRCFNRADARTFIVLCQDNPGKRVRVYAHDGFVANAYGYKSAITYAERDKDGQFHVSRTGASRPNGRGSLRVVANQGVL